MILTIAVLFGLLAGGLRAIVYKRAIKIPNLSAAWLLFLAFCFQAMIFSIPWSRSRIDDRPASILLMGTMAILLIFCWINRAHRAIWVMGLGVALNLLVIVLNGGWMPISPDTIHRRSPNMPDTAWTAGSRLGYGKDIVLDEEDTRLPWLSDRFVTPQAFPYHVAFSIGDVLIALGVFWILWSIGDRPPGL